MEPEDILSSSLGTLYDYAPIVHSSPGGLFTYTHRPQDSDSPSLEVTLSVPDTETDHWSLHASNIWTSALYVVDHISELDLPAKEEIDAPPLRLIELGAGSGLPSILIAKCYPHISVVASDFPDSKLIHTLRENIARNNASQNCTVVPHAWGTDPSGHSGVLLPTADNRPRGRHALGRGTARRAAPHALCNPRTQARGARASRRGTAYGTVHARCILSCGAGGGARACASDGEGGAKGREGQSVEGVGCSSLVGGGCRRGRGRAGAKTVDCLGRAEVGRFVSAHVAFLGDAWACCCTN